MSNAVGNCSSGTQLLQGLLQSCISAANPIDWPLVFTHQRKISQFSSAHWWPPSILMIRKWRRRGCFSCAVAVGIDYEYWCIDVSIESIWEFLFLVLCSIYTMTLIILPLQKCKRIKYGKQNLKKVCAKNEKSQMSDWHEILAGEIGFNLREQGKNW